MSRKLENAHTRKFAITCFLHLKEKVNHTTLFNIRRHIDTSKFALTETTRKKIEVKLTLDMLHAGKISFLHNCKLCDKKIFTTFSTKTKDSCFASDKVLPQCNETRLKRTP